MSVIKHILSNTIHRWFKAGVLLGLAVLMLAPSTNAQTIADSPCDPEYYDSLKSRAWLEAQREITQNQNLIFKPDSVLEYTCFGGHLAELSNHAKDMFSENGRWGVNPGNMAGALSDLVYTAAQSYLTANFAHDPLGGRADGMDTEFGFPGTDYECDVMNRVWMEAKCMDFINNETHDGFYTLKEYQESGEDHRFLPQACLALQGRWENNLLTALDTDTTPWLEDGINPYISELKNESCTTVHPLETGLKVTLLDGAPFIEKVCVPPGCYYDGAKCVNSFTPP